MKHERFNDLITIMGWDVPRLARHLSVDTSVIWSMKTGRRRIPLNLFAWVEAKALGKEVAALPVDWNPANFVRAHREAASKR